MTFNSHEVLQIDVHLDWQDFFFAVQELKNCKYDETFHDKDWFRLNPLEIFLLGLQSVGANGQVTGKFATVVIAISDVRCHFICQPRIAISSFEVLVKILISPQCSLLMWQRCWDILKLILQQAKEHPRLSLWLFPIIARHQQCLLTEVKSPLHRDQVKEELASVSDFISEPFDLAKLLRRNYAAQVVKDLHQLPGFNGLFTLLNRIRHDCIQWWLCLLLQILLDQFEQNEPPLQSNHPGEEVECREDYQCKMSRLNEILLEISTILHKMLMVDSELSSVTLPLKILQNFAVNLAKCQDIKNRQRYLDSSSFVADVFSNYVQGVDCIFRIDLLCHLYEFLTSADEANFTRERSLTFYLPNLLGTVFQSSDPAILCAVLNYGGLAIKSKHRKTLLGNGLFFMKKVTDLFEPIAVLREKLNALMVRIDAVSLAVDIRDELLEMVEERAHMSSSRHEQTAKKSRRNMFMDVVDGLRVNITRIVSSLSPYEADEEVTKRDITKLLIKMASSLVEVGQDISYTFASVLPNVFYISVFPEIPDFLPANYFAAYPMAKGIVKWKIDKRELALKLLPFCNRCIELGVSNPFEICAGLLPRLVGNIDKAILEDSQKMDLLIEFIAVCNQECHSAQFLKSLISDGIDIVSMLMPSNGYNQIVNFLRGSGKLLTKLIGTASLFFLKVSCSFMLKSFPGHGDDVKKLFMMLLTKNNRDEIRCVYSLCQDWLVDSHMSFVVDALFRYSKGLLNVKSLQGFTEVVLIVVNLQRQWLRYAEWSINMGMTGEVEQTRNQNEEESKTEERKRSCQECICYILEDVKHAIGSPKELKSLTVLKEKLYRLSLFDVLFQGHLRELLFTDYTKIFYTVENIAFPNDVKQNRKVMGILQTCALRITNMQTPRYESLKIFLQSVLQEYLRLEIDSSNQGKDTFGESSEEYFAKESKAEDSTCLPNISARRASMFEEVFIQALPKNQELKTRLMKMGYNPQIWSQDVSVTVTTDGALNTDENHRQTLLACFREYVGIFKQLGVSQLYFDGKAIPVEDVFGDDLPLVELKGRRAAVVREIEKQCNQRNHTRLQQRKFALLAEEERIEADLEKLLATPSKPKTFLAKLNVTFMDCAACCGPQIVGCYAPTGEHCERPLEIGMRMDSAIASIYNEQGIEIENAEILFTDQGFYIFKSYSTGHPYDTSKVWLELFKKIVDELELVHAIILPFHFPNRHTWQEVRTHGPTEMTGTVLTCEFDFNNDWRSYYDYRPESIRAGKDIVVNKGFFSGSVATSMKGFHRQVSFSTCKDLGGLVFNKLMDRILEDDSLRDFRFLGKHLAAYINQTLEQGKSDFAVVGNNFNYDRWRKKKDVNISKEDILQCLKLEADQCILDYISSLGLDDFCVHKRKQFFQLKDFVNKAKHNLLLDNGEFLSSEKVNAVLKRNITFQNITNLPESVQESLMHWIFSNEDRVWRYRGGRDGYETLDQYLRFLPRLRNGGNVGPRLPSFPGIIACVKSETFSVKDVVGYAVGEYVSSRESEENSSFLPEVTDVDALDCYEIVTAWVDRRYRGLNIATELYAEIFQHVHSHYIMFDILAGTLDRIINGNFFLRNLKVLGLPSLLIKTQKLSYQVTTTSGDERFEKVVLRATPLTFAMKVYTAVKSCGFYKSCLILLVTLVFAILMHIIFGK